MSHDILVRMSYYKSWIWNIKPYLISFNVPANYSIWIEGRGGCRSRWNSITLSKKRYWFLMKIGTRLKQFNKMIKTQCPCSFKRKNADEYGHLGPFDKNCAQPETEQIGAIFSMMYVISYRTWLECPYFYLPSKVDLIWIRAILPVLAQSVQFNEIAIFFLIERKHCSFED